MRVTLLFSRRLDESRSAGDPAPGSGAERHGGAGDVQLVEIDLFVRAVSLRVASRAEESAGDPELRVPGQFRGRGRCLGARFLVCLLEGCNQTLDEGMIGKGLRGWEVGIAQLPRESWRMLAQPGVRLTHGLHERFDFAPDRLERFPWQEPEVEFDRAVVRRSAGVRYDIELALCDPTRRFCEFCGRPIARKFWQAMTERGAGVFCDPAHAMLHATYPVSTVWNAD
jgi:hypothetical protein